MLYGKKLYFVNFIYVIISRIFSLKKLNNDNKNGHFCGKMQNIIYIWSEKWILTIRKN